MQYSGVYLGSLDSNETRLILRGESRALYSEGHLLYRVDSTLMAQAIDETSMELRADGPGKREMREPSRSVVPRAT